MTAIPTRERKPRRSGVSARWGEKLATRFCPVSSFFLRNYHRLAANGRGLTSTQVLLIVHVLDYQWGSSPAHPSSAALAERLGIRERAVRQAISKLTADGYLSRKPGPNGRNLFSFDGLISVLEKMLDDDEAAKAAAANANGSEQRPEQKEQAA